MSPTIVVCTVLYCSVLYCSVLYCTLHYTTLHYTALTSVPCVLYTTLTPTREEIGFRIVGGGPTGNYLHYSTPRSDSTRGDPVRVKSQVAHFFFLYHYLF
jgi:hypothetical protein